MNTLPEDIQDTIYKYKHQLEFKNVTTELSEAIAYWCNEQLEYRYCKSRHMPILNKCQNEFKCLDDYETHLSVYLKPKDILLIVDNTFEL
jgi:hypothetical protein